MLTPRAVAHAALRFIGCPYVWKGKGLELWTPQGLQRHGYGTHVFDCSGLIGMALLTAGGKDRRATHAAQTYFDEFPAIDNAEMFGALRFYGVGPKAITHISLSLGNGLIIEAAGGDSTTTTLQAAKARPNAKVRVGFDIRRDLVGARLLPGD